MYAWLEKAGTLHKQTVTLLIQSICPIKTRRFIILVRHGAVSAAQHYPVMLYLGEDKQGHRHVWASDAALIRQKNARRQCF